MRKFIIMALLSIYAFSLTVSDIEVMRKSGVLVAFPNESKAHTISKNIKPSKLITVSYIKLNNQSLYFVPSWLPKMTNLVKLELKNTKLSLKELAKLKTLTKLNTLDISDNPLFKKGGSLVDFLSAFSLSELYLANTGGSSSDYSNIGSLRSLIKLDLSGNSISDIDGLELQNLTRLKNLFLANNSIDGTLDTNDLPKESLVKLDVSRNFIEKFSFSGDFPSLVSLNILYMKVLNIKFAEEYDNPYLFPKLMQCKVNLSYRDNLPKSIIERVMKKDWGYSVYLGHKAKIKFVAISADGKFALSGDSDGYMIYRNLRTSKVLKTFNIGDTITSIAISPNGKFALSTSITYESSLKYWNLETGELHTFKNSKWKNSVAFSPNGKFALVGTSSTEGSYIIYKNLKSAKTIQYLFGHKNDVRSITISSDGKFALSGSWDKTLRYWDISTGKTIKVLVGHTNWVESVAISSDGKFALSGSEDKTLRYWDLNTGKTIKVLTGHTESVNSVAISKNGKFAISGSSDGTIRYWDLNTGKTIKVLNCGYGSYSVAFGKNDKYVLSGGSDGILRYYNLNE